VLPGWFGLGSALEWLTREEPRGLVLLQEMYRKWPFFRTVINNAQLELIRAHLPTAEWYVPRVHPAELGNRIHGIIREEYDRTCAVILQVTGEPELLAGSPVIRRTVTLRNPSVAPLSKLQVWLLETWDRLQPDEDAPEPDPVWREAILLSIIGIAAAMQSTG
jgi:phosphoenolpyruvate carboxylase